MAKRCDLDPAATDDDVSQHLATSPVTKLDDPDEALRAAIKAALDAGDLRRVRALLDVLDPPNAPVVELAPRSRAVK